MRGCGVLGLMASQGEEAIFPQDWGAGERASLRNSQLAIRNSQFAIRNSQFAICNTQFATHFIE
jgi:hypothetical protein